jgi:hypothetical protein
MPAAATWGLLGLGAGWLAVAFPAVRWIALAVAAGYGGYYGAVELSGRRALSPPGRAWQVPQAMLIDAVPRRRILVWGVLLGPGFATRNPFAGFGLLPLAVTAMPGIGPAAALGAGIGLVHGMARALALLRDVRDLNAAPAGIGPAGILPAGIESVGIVPAAASVALVPTHLDMALKTIYWRRFDGAALLAVAGVAAIACLSYIT